MTDNATVILAFNAMERRRIFWQEQMCESDRPKDSVERFYNMITGLKWAQSELAHAAGLTVDYLEKEFKKSQDDSK
jgi:hypothetical protein